MSTTTPLPIRPMTILTGVRATIAAAATATAGQQSFTLEIITGCFIVAAAAVGPFINEFFRNRRTNKGTDALAKSLAEQARLLQEIEDRDDTIRQLQQRRKPHA